MNQIREIQSVVDLYSILLLNKNQTYTKRVGLFNNLVENFFKNIFISEKDFIFEYRLKFSNNLLMESFSPTNQFSSKKIIDWVINKLEFQEIFLKEQYSQQTLDDKAYYYTSQGKLVQGKKNAPDGIEAKYVYPDLYSGKPNDPLSVPKDPKKLPTQIDASYIERVKTQKNEFERTTTQISRNDLIQKQIAPKCKEKNYDYIPYNIPANALGQGSKPENNLKYWCVTNYCNNHRDQLKTPDGIKCKNNTTLAKIKEVGWDGFFEFLREQMNSVAGAAVQVVLDIFGAGVGVQFAWFVLLCWDVSRPEKNWLNIFVDVVGILTFGTGPSTLMATLKSLGVSLTKLTEFEVIQLIATHKKDLQIGNNFS